MCIYFLVSLRELETHVTRHIKLSTDGGYAHAYGYGECKYSDIRYM
jgi:hypothetical protein